MFESFAFKINSFAVFSVSLFLGNSKKEIVYDLLYKIRLNPAQNHGALN